MLSKGARCSTRWLPKSHKPLISSRLLQSRSSLGSLTTSELPNVNPIVPLRKQLKSEAKERRLQKRNGLSDEEELRLQRWELTVGIEVHAELNTARKLFSDAATSTNEKPNSNVALFDLAYPGSQPQFQIATLLPALRAAIAFNCTIQHKSTFDRKHYFYQDQPAGYQITQYYGDFAP
jgi:aspartyl-tRNA(Asn)/glutamyl-tRNA(Gln) amidotransferase subunit B